MNENGFWRVLSGGFKEIQRSACICVKVIKKDVSCAVMRRLGCCMHDYIWPGMLQKPQNRFAVAYVEAMVFVPWDIVAKPLEGP